MTAFPQIVFPPRPLGEVAQTQPTSLQGTTHQSIPLQLAQAEIPDSSVSEESPSFSPAIATGVPLALILLGGALSVWFLRSFMCICRPNEVVVLSGRKRRTADGQEMGYKVISGGRAIRIPILESLKRLSVSTMPITVEIRNAYAKGGTPLNIQAIANIKLSSRPEIVGNAIERFLDCKPEEIARVARETLEGNLRGVVATLTPEEVNEDRLRFVERIEADVRRDLMKLGLEIDTLKIQSVSDDVNYLSSIGRTQIALIIRDAEIAESDALGAAERIEAECEQQAEVAKTQNRIAVLEQENDLRRVKAKLEQQAKSEEEVTIAAAKEKRAKFEQTLQGVRAELERLRLEADEVLPAEAQRQAQELQARGAAAPYEENAKAAAMVNQMLSQVWLEAGKDASELFVIQQLEAILAETTKIPSRLHLGQINVVDNGDGQSLASLVKVYPQILLQFLDSIHQTLGLDIIGALNPERGVGALNPERGVGALNPERGVGALNPERGDRQTSAVSSPMAPPAPSGLTGSGEPKLP